ncbi:hypothetical protein WA026_012298 [Henosepilachna vigintioctopunctata]|uniref:Uncharacterized protein n=1 Tax=Henosepilachna vigintioctopunctata TaxID=420089 RepID=A0AAW1URV8_9CUCU
MGELLGNAFKRGVQTALSGLKTTGIFLYNPDVFSDELFKPAEVMNIESDITTSRIGIPQSPQLGSSKSVLPIRKSSQGDNTNPNIENMYFSPNDIMPVPKIDQKEAR